MYSDPCGAKIGCGGATMHVLEQLEQSVPKSELEQGKYTIVFGLGTHINCICMCTILAIVNWDVTQWITSQTCACTVHLPCVCRPTLLSPACFACVCVQMDLS